MSIIHKWQRLRAESKHLIDCPEKGQEIKNLFDRGHDFIHHHGELMFWLGFIVGTICMSVVIIIAKIILVG